MHLNIPSRQSSSIGTVHNATSSTLKLQVYRLVVRFSLLWANGLPSTHSPKTWKSITVAAPVIRQDRLSHHPRYGDKDLQPAALNHGTQEVFTQLQFLNPKNPKP